MPLHLILILLISLALYCIVNAGILAVLFSWYFALPRRKAFFSTALTKSILSQFLVIAFQVIFFMWYCRFERLFSNIGIIKACPAFNEEIILLQLPMPLLIVFSLFALLIQFYFLRHLYRIKDETLLLLLLISNGVAAVVRWIMVVFCLA